MTSKTTTSRSDLQKDPTVAQTGPGLPDESGRDPIQMSDEEVERVRQKLVGGNPHAELVKEVEQDIDLPSKGSA